ncbi:hypothetical protein C4D60_Mb01t12690 [Musa balbisiana]|uniref:Uncharacterized protein n=1 Tax=Musa balbisiana TaxID=52838 RepID=A0A4S8JM10_MUSBA|nr:hypothetical protein C4D60_Mb01t12690 [Musa balbisiana]
MGIHPQTPASYKPAWIPRGWSDEGDNKNPSFLSCHVMPMWFLACNVIFVFITQHLIVSSVGSKDARQDWQ